MTKLRGTMLVPGVSANRRLYTPELIQKAYDKLAERIKDGLNPVTMMTHHEAGDDSTRIVARVTSVSLNDGQLDYTAETADTEEATTITALVAPKGGKPAFLRGVSIRGCWIGEPTTQMYEGQSVTTADDMEIDGLDFTKNPGVAGAFVEPTTETTTSESAGRVLIRETVETRAVFTEAANTKPYGDVRYADPGYQSDKVKRYPLDTKAHAKAAWSYINQADNQKMYTASQLKRIRARIKSALTKYGVNVTEATEMPAPLTEAATTLSEYYPCDGPDGMAGFSISAYNGPLTVTVSAYSGVEPADLSDVAMAAMKAACDAIHALDPDDDGDIDTGASEQTPDEDQMETAPASETVKESHVDETPAPAEETASAATEEAAPVVEESSTEETPVAESEAEAPLTRADLTAAVAAAVSAALAPPAVVEPTTETAAPDADELRESIRAELIKEAITNGVITRKGLVETTGDEPAKPLHEMTDEEFRVYQQERSALFFTHNQ